MLQRSITVSIGITALLLTAFGSVSRLTAQEFERFPEFYRTLRINALEELVFCDSAERPQREPHVYGVMRDSLGRPVRISRFFFGNIWTRGGWSTLRITYLRPDTVNLLLERRTYHAPNGAPLEIDHAYGEEVFRRPNGRLLVRRLIDRHDEPLWDVPRVVRTHYEYIDSTTIFQEWFYGNNKQIYGKGFDGPLRSFQEIPTFGYFREYRVDAQGNLRQERLMRLNRSPLPFAGGAPMLRYSRDECGRIVRADVIDLEGNPTADSSGVAWTTFEYDSFGRETARRYYGPNGDPTAGEPDGTAAIVRRYREFDGVLLEEKHLDVSGNPIETPPSGK